jgi:hypothetical protein
VVVALCVIALEVFFSVPPPTFPPLPNPNGYDDFVKAGGLVRDHAEMPYEMDRETLSAFISTNSEALKLVRLGLSRTCSVPTAEVLTNFTGRYNDLIAVKRLAQLMAGEARLAVMEGRTKDAARIYVETMRFGSELSRGGSLIHHLVSIGCEAIGAAPLAKLLPALTCEEEHPLILALEQIDREQVRWDEVWRLEKIFMRHEIGKTPYPIRLIEEWLQARSYKKNEEQKHNRNDARVRLLATELALRCFQFDHGRAPSRLEELVPKYLQRVPQDPFSGQPLVYSGQGTHWLLYSIGPNRVDDGGLPVGKGWSNQVSNGDLLFNSPYY